MKRLLRAKLVQALLAGAVYGYIELVIATLRWRIENRDGADRAIAADAGVIGLFWHGRIAHAMACRPILKTKPRRVMISLSRDGDFIAKAAAWLGIPTLRGSTGKADDGGAKGGAAAFRTALAALRAGEALVMTPDGPRGPAELMQVGAVQLARASGAPVFLMGLAAGASIRLGSWDGGRLPLPFARAALVLEGPLRIGPDDDVEATRADWQARLRAAQARAEALVAGAKT